MDEKLGVALPEKSYAVNCSLTWKNIQDQVNDFFVFCHVAGFFGKALLLRDPWLCWLNSVLFEVLEYSLVHHLPNFAECWWDHVKRFTSSLTEPHHLVLSSFVFSGSWTSFFVIGSEFS